jgi:hypothetical protein
MHLRICGSCKSANLISANRKKYMVHISQIATFANLKKIKSANLQICDLRNLFADRPPLITGIYALFRLNILTKFSMRDVRNYLKASIYTLLSETQMLKTINATESFLLFLWQIYAMKIIFSVRFIDRKFLQIHLFKG